MSLAIVLSRALIGIRAPEVIVEVHLGPGLPTFTIVGLPDAEVREAKDRVRAALNHARFEFPARRITVNLAPADLPKDSSRLDLPIALGILAASGQISSATLAGLEFAGELSLTGELRPVRGALAMALAVREAGRGFVLPEQNAAEAALAPGAHVLPARSLLAVCAHLQDAEPLVPFVLETEATQPRYADLAEVKGQAQAKRALEVAAAGGHCLLMVGPPGTGKSMLAARFPGLLPDMSADEAIESAAIQSLGSAGFRLEHWRCRPFRAPHHSASSVAIVGGGSHPRPGEISLAHNGVLFMDEMPEFDRGVLEVLREPLESGKVAISRASRQVEFPARFQLVAAMNPCPCGYLGHVSGRCRCTPDQIARYRARLSGPLLDRIDIKIDVQDVAAEDLSRMSGGESSSVIRERVEHARAKMIVRQEKDNARLAPQEIDRYCMPDEKGAMLLKHAISSLGLSARGYHRILKVARTIADLAGAERVSEAQVAEAIQYRRFDRMHRSNDAL